MPEVVCGFQPSDLVAYNHNQLEKIDLLVGGKVRMASHFKESSANPLRSFQKGTPADPEYFKKVSVKSIRDALLSANSEKPQVVEPTDLQHRKYKHRGSLRLPSPQRLDASCRVLRRRQSAHRH